MVKFENWLILEEIKTDIYENSIRNLMLEDVAKEAIRLIFEYLEDDEDEEVELDNPFSGDEDAKPISILDDEDEEEIVTNIKKDWKKILRNSTLWLRWKAIAERKADVYKLKMLLDEYEKSIKNEEYEFDDDDDDDFENQFKSFNIKKVIPILEKLGYVEESDLDWDENYEKTKQNVIDLMYQASKEDNNLPSDVKNNDLFSNWDSYVSGQDEKLKPSSKVIQASEDFFTSIKEIFKKSFYKIQSRSREMVKMGGKTRVGYTLFSDIDDVASSFALMMISNLTQKKWKWIKGEKVLQGWNDSNNMANQVIKKSTKKDLDKNDEKDIEKIMAYFRTFLGKISEKEEDQLAQVHSPEMRIPDSIKNRSKKANLINEDLKKNNLKYYKDYLEEHSKGNSKSVGWWGERDKESKKAKKIELSSLSSEDKLRIEIMSHIVYLQSKNSLLLSLDPNKIEETLTNYRNDFLIKGKPNPVFFGSMKSKQSDDGDDYDPTADDSVGKEDSLGVGSSLNPANIARSNEYKIKLSNALYRVLSSSSFSSQERLVMCLKWGLNCTEKGALLSKVDFNNTVVRLTKAGEIVGSNKTNCANQIEAIGLDSNEVMSKITDMNMNSFFGLSEDLKSNLAKVNRIIRKASKKICRLLPEELNKRTVTSLPAQRSINTRYVAGRKSPLSVRR